MRYLYAFGIMMILGGCQSVEDGNRCSEYGFVRGTSAFAHCMQRIDMSRERRAERSMYAPIYDY